MDLDISNILLILRSITDDLNIDTFQVFMGTNYICQRIKRLSQYLLENKILIKNEHKVSLLESLNKCKNENTTSYFIPKCGYYNFTVPVDELIQEVSKCKSH